MGLVGSPQGWWGPHEVVGSQNQGPLGIPMGLWDPHGLVGSPQGWWGSCSAGGVPMGLLGSLQCWWDPYKAGGVPTRLVRSPWACGVPAVLVRSPWAGGIPAVLAGPLFLQYGSPRFEQDEHCAAGVIWAGAEDQSISDSREKPKPLGWVRTGGLQRRGAWTGARGWLWCWEPQQQRLVLLQCVPALPSEVQALRLRRRNAG